MTILYYKARSTDEHAFLHKFSLMASFIYLCAAKIDNCSLPKNLVPNVYGFGKQLGLDVR
jgi:hypothetical protein